MKIDLVDGASSGTVQAALSWVPVSERLPEPWVEVMVWPHPCDQTMTAQLRTDGKWEYQEYVHNHGWDSVAIQPPTHWMPLPAPPGTV